MLDLHDLDRWARELDLVADDVRAARRRLDSGAAGMQWSSTAARRFEAEVAEHAGRLERCAADLTQAAAALRAHARAAQARAAALGDAAGDVLAAARAAAGQGVAAVGAAVDVAEQAFEQAQAAARAALATGDRLLDRAWDAVR